MKYKQIPVVLFFFFFFVLESFAQDQRYNRYEAEAGILKTNSMEISGYNQGNATSNFGGYEPTGRFEYWSVQKKGWNYGVVAQPLFAHYNDTISDDLNAKGGVYKKGEQGSLDYQFHTLRATANYELLTSSDQRDYFRLGGSLIARYAELKFKGVSDSFHDRNFIVLPTINVEGEVGLTSRYSIFTRSDFLPSPDGNVFLDGLFDVLVALRRNMQQNEKLDIGIRLFFGGYDPDKVDDYANKIFFTGAVIRYSW